MAEGEVGPVKRSDGKIGQGVQNGPVKFDRLGVRLGRSHRISARDGRRVQQ